MMGELATRVAIIAVASVGYLLLTGRVAYRRGARVIVGCFLLFGAPTIAEGLLGTLVDTSAAPLPTTPLPPPPLPIVASPAPYSGASVPYRASKFD